jgi:putative glycosyl hydrolase-like family 15 (GHL15) protein
MKSLRTLLIRVAVAASLLNAAAALGYDPSPGGVRFFRLTDIRSDAFLASPSPDQQAWMRAHYWRMLVFAPYFDSRLAWYPDAWAFKDLYAVYPGSPLAAQHPEWILRDGAGREAYIPYKCHHGTCPQFAGDLGSPAFRAQWIAEAVASVAPGYRGLFVSDVSLVPRTSDGSRRAIRVIDPRTGRPMTATDWGRYVAEFCEQIRAALPGKEIVHDALWFASVDDPSVQREVDSADFVYFHRGFNDRAIRGGKGPYGFQTFLSNIDGVHARGKGVVVESTEKALAAIEYNLAGYFLVDEGADGVGSDRGGGPTGWWSGYDVTLGAPLGPRYPWNGVQRRDFANGLVLVNAPGSSGRTLTLPRALVDLRGRHRTAVHLGAARGVVLTAP